MQSVGSESLYEIEPCLLEIEHQIVSFFNDKEQNTGVLLRRGAPYGQLGGRTCFTMIY